MIDKKCKIEIPSADRKELLKQAINEINSLPSHLGDNGDIKQTKRAEILTEIMDDAVKLSALPVIYKINDDGFLAKGFELPVDIQQIKFGDQYILQNHKESSQSVKKLLISTQKWE